MDKAATDRAREAVFDAPLESLCPADAELFRTDSYGPMFERLRKESPIHWSESSDPDIGGFWSISRYNDIMDVDIDYETFSSAGSIALGSMGDENPLPMFIAMDPPTHDEHRKVVQPIVAGPNLMALGPIIRERTINILDSMPIGETFDLVDTLSSELTTMTLATLFDFPWEERAKLTQWSKMLLAADDSPIFKTDDPKTERMTELFQMVDYFLNLWNDRANKPPGTDLISMLAHGEATKNMDRMEFLGILCLLIVGGTDTTRNTISGSVLATHQNPGEFKKVLDNRELIPSMVSESIRWQTPVIYMRRTATRDVEMHGKKIRKGDKVAIWYVSGNRDETVIEDPLAYRIDRPQVRRHISFGFGIHRCVGNRLAEQQLKIVWEEILKRFPKGIEVVGEPIRSNSMLVRGYDYMPVQIPKRH